jgi:hypothetical protein
MKKKSSFLSGYKTYDTSKGYGNANEWQEAFRARMTSEDAERIIGEDLDQMEEDDSILFQRRVRAWDLDALYRHAEKILGVTEDTPPKEIRDKYYKLMQQWHNEDGKHPHPEKAMQMSQKLAAAYSILTDKHK